MNGFYYAHCPVHFVHFYLHDCFCLVIQFRADVTTGILVILVLMENGMNVNLAVIRPLHESGNNIGRFTWGIDVIKKVSDAIYNHQSEIEDCADSLFDYSQTYRRGVLAQSQHNQIVWILVLRESGKAQDSFQYLLAMMASLFCINVQNSSLILWK